MRDILDIESDIVVELRTVFDPEVPVNVYDLGLIYDVDVQDDGKVDITMTLTAPNCPVADDVVQEVKTAVGSVEGVTGVEVKLVFDPPWDQSRMSEEAKLDLGLTTPPKVSRYALLRDYHKLLKSRLFTLLNRLRAQYGAVEGRPFVDSAPFLDRYWAVLGGLGWIGKNGLLISPRWGSFVFIGALVVTLEVEPREGAMPARCGKCTRCLDACPTKALLQPALLDARRCISYLTIEKKSPLTEGERALLDGWAYGCDVCQMVCPWNRRAARSGLEREVLIDRGLLDAYAQGKADLPPDSPMRRANPARLRELLGGGREGLEGITLPARER